MASYLRNTKTFSSPGLDANRGRAAKTETAEPIIQADEILTIEETAAMQKVKKRAVYNLIFEGELRASASINGISES